MRGLTPTEATVARTLLARESGSPADRAPTPDEREAGQTLFACGRLTVGTCACGCGETEYRRNGALREALRLHDLLSAMGGTP